MGGFVATHPEEEKIKTIEKKIQQINVSTISSIEPEIMYKNPALVLRAGNDNYRIWNMNNQLKKYCKNGLLKEI